MARFCLAEARLAVLDAKRPAEAARFVKVRGGLANLCLHYSRACQEAGSKVEGVAGRLLLAQSLRLLKVGAVSEAWCWRAA